jgi:hypothetical protein
MVIKYLSRHKRLTRDKKKKVEQEEEWDEQVRLL